MKTKHESTNLILLTSIVAFVAQTCAADGYWDARFGALGLLGGVNTVAVSGTNVYVGGSFTKAGSVNATNIARWNGTSWSALGNGVNDRVYAIAVQGNQVFAGGKFTQAGSVNVNFIAKWDGSSWSALGTGANNGVGGYVYTLAARTDGPAGVYVGGAFVVANKSDGTSLTANYIAQWISNSWSTLGTGVGGYVYGITVSGSNAYVGGNFTTAGSVGANHVARWNNGWAALTNIFGQNGVNGYVNAIAVNGSNVYVGGNFTGAAGSTGFTNIARYDYSMPALPTWRSVGVGLNDIVLTMAANGTNVYVGGYFTLAGTNSAKRIARWDGTSWSALSSGLSSGPDRLEPGDGQIYVGGGFTTAGGKPSDGFAIWHETPVLRPDIVGIHFSGSDCLINFITQAGQEYYAERCNSLPSTNWYTFTNLICGFSGGIIVTDRLAAVNATNRFYRVRSQ